MVRQKNQIGMNYSSELPQWEFGVSVPLRMYSKAFMGHCEQNIMKWCNTADTLSVGYVIVLERSFRKRRTSQLAIFRCTYRKIAPVLRTASNYLHLI